jgi:hypothetical protein
MGDRGVEGEVLALLQQAMVMRNGDTLLAQVTKGHSQ